MVAVFDVVSAAWLAYAPQWMTEGRQRAGGLPTGHTPMLGWPWVAAQMLLLAAIAAAGWYGGEHWRHGATTLCGYVLLGVGGVVALLGAWQLGRQLTPFPAPLSRARMVDSGIYAWVRHPQYASLMLAATGWGLVRASPAALLLTLALLLFLDRKSQFEERLLREVFPEYERYASRVRRLIPWIY